MSWPTMTDYQEAIQNPHFCFSDPELRSGTPVLNVLGLPKPITGAFASVYQMNCGKRQYAVRCFLRYFPDQQQRYAAIGNYLEQVKLPYMVSFKLLQQGIRVQGQWYPILKMEWLDGVPLNIAIEQNLGRGKTLTMLADRFVQMAADLHRHSIAHGDLQHGNIMVVDDSLKLIDYDGMYVPSLHGMRSHELGHRNYQHPDRTEADFGPHIDNFSTWVIYLSLLALREQPSLWNWLKGGDECLLFRQTDFENFDVSQVMQALGQIHDSNVQTLLESFRALLQRPLSQVPSIIRNSTAPLERHRGAPLRAGGKHWIEDYFPSAGQSPNPADALAAVGGRAVGAGPVPAGADWIWDYIDSPAGESPPPAAPAQSTVAQPAALIERYIIGGGLFVGYAVLVALVMGLISLPGAAVVAAVIGGLVGGYLGIQYALFPEVRHKRRLLLEQLRLHWLMGMARRRLQRADAQLAALILEEQEAFDALDASVEQQLEAELARHPLRRREIRGMTSYVERQLHEAGIRAALDVSYPVVLAVTGVDHRLAIALVRWREAVEDDLRDGKLRPLMLWQMSQKQALRQDYQQQRQTVQDRVVAAKQDVFQLESEQMALSHELSNYDDVTFAAYLRWIF